MRSVNTARERATGALRARYYTPAWTTPKAVLAGTPEALLPRKHSCGARVGLPSRPLIHHDRRHKRSKPTSDAGKKGAKSITEFQKRDPASTSFESIDRRSF